MSKTQPARGMRDFLPADVRKRNYVIGVIKQVYESYGFEPLETPSVENLETLMGKYGEEGNQLVFKILKRGEKLDISKGESGLADLALRYDLTVPLARVVANYRNELPKFFKRYQIQPVWRADRPARGRYREFYQCDVDAIGSSSMIVEAELISAVCEILRRLGFDDFIVKLNSRKILTDMLDSASIPVGKHTDALVAIDKLDKIGRDGVSRELSERGISESSATKLLGLFGNSVGRGNADVLASLGEFVKVETLSELTQILEFAPNAPIALDPSLARGLSYYTGAIFEISVPDLAGSLGGGGRYDGLIGMFGKEQIPACGFSLGLERILVVMEERGMFPPELSNSAADVMVTVWSEESVGESMRLASELRAAGLRVLVYPEAEKLGKQFKYAGQIGVKHVCVLGESEVAEGVVAVKDMATGEQVSIARKDIAARLFES
ncbi:MAG: histidine--tRNA ligase [Acidobacteria bacterium]|nr:histidine--tRNA ligase [Acidobacteriota bacterium]